MTVTKTTKEEVKNFTMKVVVIVQGGMKDVGKNETTNGLRRL
jgi:hypothetical protein